MDDTNAQYEDRDDELSSEQVQREFDRATMNDQGNTQVNAEAASASEEEPTEDG